MIGKFKKAVYGYLKMPWFIIIFSTNFSKGHVGGYIYIQCICICIYIYGWWFETAVGSTPTSRCGRALPIVERFVHRFVPWISSWILQMSTLEVGSPLWSRLVSLVLRMSAIWSDQFSVVPFWCLVASLMVLLMCSPFWMLSWCSFSLFRRWRWMMLLGSCITYSMHGRTSSNWSMLAAG